MECCDSNAFGCEDDGYNFCGFQDTYDYSFLFEDMPDGSRGQGYTEGGCVDYLFAVNGPGYQCWEGGDQQGLSMNWFYPSARRRSSDAQIDARVNAMANKTCMPKFFQYKDNHGTEKRIKVPVGDPDAANTIAKLRAEDAFDALAKYEKY